MDTLLQHVRRNMLLHAYGIEGSWEDIKPALLSFAQDTLKLPLTGAHPDARLVEVDVFGIDESRSLERAAREKGIAGDEKLFVVQAQVVTGEAQNALLKLLEDAPKGLHVILVVPSFSRLLPTLRSRLFLVQGMSGDVSAELTRTAQQFFKVSKKERLEMVAPLIEAKDRDGALTFLNGLEVVLSRELSESCNTRGLREVLAARTYMSDRSSSIKLLLEHLALTL